MRPPCRVSVAGDVSSDGGRNGKQRAGALAVVVAVGAVLAVLLQATELGEKISDWIRGDHDSGRLVAVDLASAVTLAEAGRSVSPVRECFEVAKAPIIIVRRRPGWPPLAAVQLFAQERDETPTPTPTGSPSPSPTASPTESPSTSPTASPTASVVPVNAPGATMNREGEEIEIVTKPRLTPTPPPDGAPAPPPPDDDDALIEGAQQNITVFPQNYSREEVERFAPQVRVGSARGGKRQPEGQLVDVELSTTGFVKHCVYARWSLYRRLSDGGKRHVPERWAVNRAAMFLRPDESPDEGSGQFWVPLPKRRRTHFVRVALFDEAGNRLGRPMESPRFR